MDSAWEGEENAVFYLQYFFSVPTDRDHQQSDPKTIICYTLLVHISSYGVSLASCTKGLLEFFLPKMWK